MTRAPSVENHAVISTIGICLPENILTNFDLEKIVETSDDWIVSRTGIHERRIGTQEEHASTFGVAAARHALEQRKIDPSSIDLIIVTTMTPDYITPSTACLIQGELGCEKAASFDLQAACTGFLYGLQMAKACIESSIYKKILLISTEKNSAFIDYEDRNTCVLFGDGAAACIIESSSAEDLPKAVLKIRSVELGSDGSLSDLIIIPGGGSRNRASPETILNRLHYLKMSGREVFKHAVRRMEIAAKKCLENAGVREEELRWLIPHQANIRIIEALGKRFNISAEKVATTITKYANTSSSTIPIALFEIFAENRLKPDDLMLLVAFGGGLTWGSSILEAIIK
ncbi:MAG: beta-ketoacyl-ACP synthase III [Chlamydia sp.]